MKKIIITIASVLITSLSIAQWNKTIVKNGFDDPYKICYTNTDNNAVLKLENTDISISFYLQGNYYCEDKPIVDILFLVNNKWIKYKIEATKSRDNKVLFFTDNIEEENYFIDFLNATSVKIRVNETYCNRDIYQFNMYGSTSAFKFIKNE